VRSGAAKLQERQRRPVGARPKNQKYNLERKMTAEVAVMNKSAVALAADSAVTIEYTQGDTQHEKVFNTANKLFTLSKHHPIGIMVNNTMELGGVPWETIVKYFRLSLSDKSQALVSGPK
jgi:adenine C2-methylase RlmN of 23S rRNA A2503 and tRNA A37